MSDSLKKVVFLDRDGVINKDSPEYVKSWSEFEFLPGSLKALKKLALGGFTVIIITNQSVINRKMVSRDALEDIHERMKAAVRSEGGHITDIFFCPHTPDENCSCRKPKPGMIFSAQKAYHIELASAYMIGDSAKDIECARNAGCGHAILVKSGSADPAEQIPVPEKARPDYAAQNLLEAVNWITTHEEAYRSPAGHP